MLLQSRIRGPARAAAFLAAFAAFAVSLLSCMLPPGGVYVSANTVQVPSLIGLDGREAANRLKQYSLHSGEVRYTASRRIRQVVVAQSPEAGTRVSVWSYVSYTLGLEAAPVPEPSRILVPNLMGMTQSRAAQALMGSGLVLAGATWSPSSAATGTVISQSPPGGTRALAGSGVSLVLSSGLQPRWIRMPDLRGLTVHAAEDRLRQNGLELGTITRAVSLSVPVDCVVSHNPAPHTRVAERTRVDLVIAQRRPQLLVRVPNVVGKSRRDAAVYIERAGLSLGPVNTLVTVSSPEGTVVNQSPAAGTMVHRGAKVVLTVAKAPAPRRVLVPKVVGMTLEGASSVLFRAGLHVGSVGKQVVPGGRGLVVSQNPGIGVWVVGGTAVNLVIGVAPAGIPVPSVIGLSLDQARISLSRAGFVPGTVGRQDPGPGGIANNTVLDQNPDAGAIFPRNSRVNLTVAWHEVQSVRVPLLRGRTYREAIEKLSAVGLKVGRVDHRTVTGGQVGRVIDQNPSANSRVWEGTAVNLVVGVKERESLVLVPVCILLSESKAVRAIKKKGLVPKVSKVIGIPRKRVIFQFPPPGTPVRKGSEVRIHVTR